MFRRLFLSVIFFICSNFLAKASFDFNANCKQAYQEVLNVRLDLAKEYVEKERLVNPENLIPVLIENYIDYFQLLTSDNKQEFDRLKKNKSQRLSKISAGDKQSPYYLFSQAEINLQWALLRGRYQEYITSALEIKRAYDMLQENAKRFPDFLPNNKGLGLLNAVLGSLPSGAQKALGLLGVKGNTALGEEMLEKLVDQLPGTAYKFIYDETVFYLMQVKINISKDNDAFRQIIEKTAQMSDQSLLKTYIRAYSAYKTGHNDEALNYLTNKPKGNAYTAYPYLTYLLAMVQLNKLDLSATDNFKLFLALNKGESYVKDSYLHLAYIAYLKGSTSQYNNYINLLKQEGSTFDERDKQALNEANEGPPNAALLKARFLFDGGYYSRAKKVLDHEDVNHYSLRRDKIEYCYRLARVFHETGGFAGAEKFYKYAIAFGKSSKYYYAANSALLLGDIYENKGQYKRAAAYYQQAIAMKNHDYEESIENKAKEGLNRMAGKY